MQAKTQLRYVKAHVDLTTGSLSRLAGELVRAGARDAHPSPGGFMTIGVVAPSHRAAQTLADDLVAKAGARSV